jgi:hypothetical protein
MDFEIGYNFYRMGYKIFKEKKSIRVGKPSVYFIYLFFYKMFLFIFFYSFIHMCYIVWIISPPTLVFILRGENWYSLEELQMLRLVSEICCRRFLSCVHSYIFFSMYMNAYVGYWSYWLCATLHFNYVFTHL